jgi:exonuclease SbcC
MRSPGISSNRRQTSTSPTAGTGPGRLLQLAPQLRENSARQGEIRQQLKQNAENQQRQQALQQEIALAGQQLEDWAWLNALIGSKEGDKFRKFAQGLTLDNLVWLANHQLNRLHGRYQLQRKASDALELEVVDTWQADAVRDTRTLSGGESFLSAWRWRWRCPIW